MDDNYLAPAVKDLSYCSRPIEDDVKGPKGKGRCCLKKVMGHSYGEGQDSVGSSCSRQGQKAFCSGCFFKVAPHLQRESQKFFDQKKHLLGQDPVDDCHGIYS